MKNTDLIGNPFSADEAEIFEIYTKLKELSQRDSLAPCASSNVKFATAAMAQVVNDLGLTWEHLYDVGI